MRRCSVPLPSNIAEGYGRASNTEFIRFLNIATGSLFELQTQLEIAYNIEYLEQSIFKSLYNDTRELEIMLVSFTNKIKRKALRAHWQKLRTSAPKNLSTFFKKMINLFNTHIESLSVHRVGNKSRSEAIFLSEQQYNPTDEIVPLLKEYFFKPFRDKEENYFQFAHDVHLDYHDMYTFATEIFTDPSKVHEVSKKITKHLFEQSNHPHIKNGEVYVTYLTNLTIDNNPVDAIGIFKSEIKTDFLQFDEKGDNLEILLQQGINLNKLDKGCLIFNYKKEEGYKILTIDHNRYDARYWLEHFLSVDAFQDENFMTKKYMKFVQDFAKDVVLPAEDKKEEVMFMNRSVNYFAKNDEFEETAFLNEVLDNPDLIPEFKNYKVEKAPKYSIEDVTTFPIANAAVTDARKKIKNVINLDTNIQIKLDFINPESAEKFVEKGWDEEKQMYYYLVYFNKEQKS